MDRHPKVRVVSSGIISQPNPCSACSIHSALDWGSMPVTFEMFQVTPTCEDYVSDMEVVGRFHFRFRHVSTEAGEDYGMSLRYLQHSTSRRGLCQQHGRVGGCN